MKRAATSVAVLVASLAGGCAGPSFTIVDDPFDVAETTSAPEISAVVDETPPWWDPRDRRSLLGLAGDSSAQEGLR